MDVRQIIESGDYISECKQEKLMCRKYPDLGLMIIKRPFGAPFSEEKPWLNYCRGLIIDYINHKVVFIPPSKSIEVSTNEGIDGQTNELVDGTMINLFWWKGEWLMATRSNIGCTNKWTQDMNFAEMFAECSTDLATDTLSTNNTYSFVMRHKKQRFTSNVETNELVLVDVYQDGQRLTELPLNKGYRLAVSGGKPGLQKGLTWHKDGIRYKWLTDGHKFIEMIKPTTNNPCLNYLILRNSGHLTSYLTLFPEKRFEFNEYRKSVHAITQITFQYYQSVHISKEIEKNNIPFALKPLLYEIHGHYLKDKQGITWAFVKQYIHDLPPKRLQFVMNQL